MSTTPELSPDLWEALMENPPPRDDALCRDVYDQANWIAEGMPLVAVRESLLHQLFWTPNRVDQLPYLVAMGQNPSLSEWKVAEKHLRTKYDWIEAELWEARHKLRDYHVFTVEQTPLQVDGERIFRVPPPAKDRLTGRTKVALFVHRSEQESLAALARRYHLR